MATRAYIHIGTPKSGTTYLQSVLWANREHLARHGTVFPGGRPFDQNRASLEVRKGRAGDPSYDGVWARFLRRIDGFAGQAVLSNEWYVSATPEQAAAAVESLGRVAEVHVVVTARSMRGLVPAAWQESLKLGNGRSLPDFVAGLEDGRAQWCWNALDPALALERWAAVVPPERVTVVTVPAQRRSPTELWDRFASAVGCTTEGVDASQAQANESLGVESARLLQEIGPQLRETVVKGGDGRWQVPYTWLRNYVSHELLVPLGGRRIGLPAPLGADLARRDETIAARLGSAGYRVVGDLADLTVGPVVPDDALTPDEVSPEALLERAAALSARLLADVQKRG